MNICIADSGTDIGINVPIL